MDNTANLTVQDRDQQLINLLNAYNKEYTEFIDLAAHELDAPLRKLSSFIEILTDKYKAVSQTDDVQEYIGRIENSIDDMRLLINDLCTLSQVISKRSDYSFFEMETIVQQALKDMEPVITEKKAVITMAIAGLRETEGDPAQYAELFTNILDNAIKFSKKGIAPEIVIRSSAISREEKNNFNLREDREYFRIEIRDNGIGFRGEYAEKIFQPFVRLNSKSHYKGNGIGLAVCKKIVENHGGILYAESTENSGSSFVIILPQTILPVC
jgi:signal transduction histidine kinase